MDFFQDTPTTAELLGYMAGAVRDCIGCAGSLDLEADAMLLWDEFGGEAGFCAERPAHLEMDLARRMSACLSAVGQISRETMVAEMALINSVAFAEGASMISLTVSVA